MVKAVITGDLISSSNFDNEKRRQIQLKLNAVLDKIFELDETKFFVYRGDSIQGIVNDPAKALRNAILIKAALKSLQFEDGKRSSTVDIRIAIGIGEINFYGGNIQESDGTAFQYSGRELENLKKSSRSLSLIYEDNGKNKIWLVILSLMDEIMNKWTTSSAEIIYHLLLNKNETTISETLKISQPAVNLRKKHAGWDAIKEVLEYYENSN